jgi:hypothetical protein
MTSNCYAGSNDSSSAGVTSKRISTSRRRNLRMAFMLVLTRRRTGKVRLAKGFNALISLGFVLRDGFNHLNGRFVLKTSYTSLMLSKKGV